MDGSKKAVVFALGGNMVIAAIKLIASFFTRSSAMLAEAIHSIADCFNQVFLLIGSKRAIKPANEQHPFGYGREEYFWGFMVAILLFFVGSMFSIYEGINKLLHPEQIHYIWWSIGILGAAVLIETKSFLVAFGEFKKKGKGNFLRAIKNSVDTNLIVILLEDSAALCGLLIAIICTILTVVVDPIFDGIGGTLIGLLLASVSYLLTNELRKLIIGESMPREDRHKIKHIIEEFRMVKHINKIQTMAVGKKYLLLLSLDFDDSENAYDIENAIEEMKVRILRKHPEIETIYIEAKDNNRNDRV
jgi:cation diffusion facilitator family transporter